MNAKPKTILDKPIRVTEQAWLTARVFVAGRPPLTIGELASEAIPFYVDHLQKRSKVANATSRG